MLTVATNTGALMAQAAASSVNRDMETSMQRLSSGKRINAARDDAAGMAISSRLESSVRGLNQSIRNALDGQALLDTAEGAMQEQEEILQRIRELAVQQCNDTISESDLISLDNEVSALATELNRIASSTSWAGQKLLDGTFTEKTFQVGGGSMAVDRLVTSIPNMSWPGAIMEISNETEDNAFSVQSKSWGYLITGKYLTFGINNKGTIGNGGSYGEGILFDPSGTGNFPASDDYIAPGTPFEGFSITFNNGEEIYANNASSHEIANSTLDYVEGQGIVWSGETDKMRVTHTYSISDNGKEILVDTTYEALENLTDIYSLRTADPDVRVDGFNDSSTTNNYIVDDGNDKYVYSEALASGYVLGLKSENQNQDHKVRISNSWTSAAEQFYTSSDSGNFASPNNSADATIGIVTKVGDLAANQTYVTNYKYFFGSDLNSALDPSSASSSSPLRKHPLINQCDTLLRNLNNQRTSIGALSNRIDHIVANNTNAANNLAISNGRINDADFAKETSDLAKAQILQQSATAMLAQANAAKQNVLSLLQG